MKRKQLQLDFHHYFTKFSFYTLECLCSCGITNCRAILVIAMVITPGATAYLLTDKFKTLIKIAVALGAITGSRRCLFKLLSGWRNRWCHRNITNLVIFIGFSILA